MARVDDLGYMLGKTERRRVTKGEVIELAMAALDDRLGDAYKPEYTPPPETETGATAHNPIDDVDVDDPSIPNEVRILARMRRERRERAEKKAAPGKGQGAAEA